MFAIRSVENRNGRRRRAAEGWSVERNGKRHNAVFVRCRERAKPRQVQIVQLGRRERNERRRVGDRVVFRLDPVGGGESIEDAQLVHVASEAIDGRVVPERTESPIRKVLVGVHEVVRAVRLVVLDAVEVGDEPQTGLVVGKGDVAPLPRGEAGTDEVRSRRPGVAALVGDGEAFPRLGQDRKALAVVPPRLAVGHKDVGAVVIVAAFSVALEPAGDGEAAGVRKLRRRLGDIDAH